MEVENAWGNGKGPGPVPSLDLSLRGLSIMSIHPHSSHNNLPTIYHPAIYSTGAARGRRQTVARVYQLDHLLFVSIIILVRIIYSLNSYFIVGNGFKWFVSYTPYLIHESSITPHITSNGVLPAADSLYRVQLVWPVITTMYYYLRCCPLDWDHPTM